MELRNFIAGIVSLLSIGLMGFSPSAFAATVVTYESRFNLEEVLYSAPEELKPYFANYRVVTKYTLPKSVDAKIRAYVATTDGGCEGCNGGGPAATEFTTYFFRVPIKMEKTLINEDTNQVVATAESVVLFRAVASSDPTDKSAVYHLSRESRYEYDGTYGDPRREHDYIPEFVDTSLKIGPFFLADSQQAAGGRLDSIVRYSESILTGVQVNELGKVTSIGELTTDKKDALEYVVIYDQKPSKRVSPIAITKLGLNLANKFVSIKK